MSDWQLYTHCGTIVSVADAYGAFVPLVGYSGGLQFGMSDSLETLPGYADGITRQIKGNAQGASSSIAVRRVDGDAGQALVKSLCDLSNDGFGFMRAEYPDGRTLTAYGIFHSMNENPVDGGEVQGFTFSFDQEQPTIED